MEFEKEAKFYAKTFLITTTLLLGAFLVSAKAQCAPNPALLANAIYKAEGGAKTKYPYGILTKYKHTTPRQACINTIRHALKDWNGKGDFIVFLGSRYCPPNAHPLNVNWVKNVRWFYERAL